jgi:hypothetical protein
MISLEEQQALLKPILETVPGLTTVRTDFPGAVQHDQLPLLWLSAGEAEYDQVTRGAQSLRIRRTWKAVLLVEKVELGNTFQAEAATKPFLTAIPVRLAAYPTLRLADGRTLHAPAVVLTTGTFLAGKLFAGDWQGVGGRIGEGALRRRRAFGRSAASAGVEELRPARVDGAWIQRVALADLLHDARVDAEAAERGRTALGRGLVAEVRLWPPRLPHVPHRSCPATLTARPDPLPD